MNKLALGLVVFALIALGMMPLISSTALPADDTPKPRLAQDSVTIVALDSLTFDPSEVNVSPGQVVVVVNDGVLQHDLVVDEWEVETGLLNNGEFASFTVPADAVPGTPVEFRCTVPGHSEAGQTGSFIVAAAEGTTPDAASADDTSSVAEVEALDSLSYSPDAIEVYPGQEVRVTNNGVMQHDLVVEPWNLATNLLDNGQQETITVPEDAEVGSVVTFYCSVPGHRQAGMGGTFIVVAPPVTGERSAIDDLNATIAALEQEQADLAATATAIATQQAQIDEQIVSLEIQRDALIDATAAAQPAPSPTLAAPHRPARTAPGDPTPTPSS